MLYGDEDRARAEKTVRRETARCVLTAAPFAALAAAALLLRLRLLCTAAAILSAFSAIFLYDLRVSPARAYRRFLAEALGGRSHETAGLLQRIGEDPVLEAGVPFRELTLNVYADLSEEGERRFLLDASRPAPEELAGRVVVVRSHDAYVLSIAPREART